MEHFQRRPAEDEYAPFYAGYVARVPERDVRDVLVEQRAVLQQLVAAFPPERHGYRYAEGKWSVREVVGHIVDGEWLFASRALFFARANPGPMPGIDQDEFLAEGNYETRTLGSIALEFDHLRAALLAQVESFTPATLDRRGTASGREMSVRALLFVTAGHAAHHLGVLRERYL